VPQESTQYFDDEHSVGITQNVPIGSMIDVSSDGGVIANEARVVEEYYSASGRHCARVELKQPGDPIRVMCEREDGGWSLTRSLLSKGNSAVSDETLIKAPLKSTESKPVRLPKVDKPSAAERLVVAFESHYSLTPTFDSDSVETSTVAPELRADLAMAGDIPDLLKSFYKAVVETPITGRR